MKQAIFAKNVALLLNFIIGQGYYVTFGEAFRTVEQAQIYFQEHKGIAHSLHCKRLAIDLNIHDSKGTYLVDDKYYSMAGKYWESLDPANRWGGNFHSGCAKGDGNHFEMQDLPEVSLPHLKYNPNGCKK
jgi:hypothetical protein